MKRYLTGIDWIINAIDYSSRKQTGVGNISQVIIEFDGLLNEPELRKQLQDCLKNNPVLCGYPARAINLCPYWKISRENKALTLNTHYFSKNLNFDDVLSFFEKQMSVSFKGKKEHLIFNLVFQEDKSFLGMIFDHRLLEARGAEAFINVLGNRLSLVTGKSLVEPSHLNNWKDKFRAGKQVNRSFLHLTKGNARCLKKDGTHSLNEFKVVTFSPQESTRIIDNSYKEAGYLMLMPYILAKSILILHRMFEKRKDPIADYLIPVSIDKRPAQLIKKDIFFNHLSFFLFRISPQEADSFPMLLASIKEQMYNQVKSGLPEAFSKASFLMRIAPLPIVYLLLRLMTKGEIASFTFSFLGESSYESKHFLNTQIQNIFHLPRVPYPPGIGIFFNQYQGRLNATLSYIKGLITEPEINQILNALRELE